MFKRMTVEMSDKRDKRASSYQTALKSTRRKATHMYSPSRPSTEETYLGLPREDLSYRSPSLRVHAP